MKVIKSISEARQWSRDQHQKNKTIGFVPTMGYLHEGHLSLIREAKKHCDVVIVSIFVNPTQFAPTEDLDRYPRDLKRDLDYCRREKTDMVFNPENKKIYSENFQTYVKNESISQILCGKTRPIHFRGVTTIVSKLFNILDPDVAVFGQKDAQQAIIIQKMVADLNFRTVIIIAPTIREKDGLAMSSRNKYLTDEQRKSATILYRSLQFLKEEIKSGNSDLEDLRKKIISDINALPDCKTDYVEFVDPKTLKTITAFNRAFLCAIAVFVGSTRLIDNMIIKK